MEYLLDKNPGFINSKKKKRLLERKREKQRGKEREGTIQGPQTSEEKLKSLQWWTRPFTTWHPFSLPPLFWGYHLVILLLPTLNHVTRTLASRTLHLHFPLSATFSRMSACLLPQSNAIFLEAFPDQLIKSKPFPQLPISLSSFTFSPLSTLQNFLFFTYYTVPLIWL